MNLGKLPGGTTQRSSIGQRRTAQWTFHSWLPAVTFVAACYAVTWLACVGFRSAAANGQMWAFWAFILVTVWSPTCIALAVTMVFGGPSSVRSLLGRLVWLRSSGLTWYIAAVVLPASSVLAAVSLARTLQQGAPLIAIQAIFPTIAIQLGTGAVGEELGWRGFLLPLLQSKVSPVISALIMSVLWGLWHAPAFFFPGLPQALISPLAFFVTVVAFGVFLSLIFNKTEGCVGGTMLAHFVFNTGLAFGGAQFGNVLWWSLAGILSVLACWSIVVLSHASGRFVRESTDGEE
jgi:membrane protease YdiL (CAAX protease family)